MANDKHAPKPLHEGHIAPPRAPAAPMPAAISSIPNPGAGYVAPPQPKSPPPANPNPKK